MSLFEASLSSFCRDWPGISGLGLLLAAFNAEEELVQCGLGAEFVFLAQKRSVGRFQAPMLSLSFGMSHWHSSM